MKTHKFHLVIGVATIVAIIALPRPATAEVKVKKNITAEEAKDHAQETNTVCGLVAGARYLESSKSKPTFLNFTRPFPEQNFTALISNDARGKFKGPPEEIFKGKTICVTGFITISRDRPQIVVNDPAQIEVQDVPVETNAPAATPSNPVKSMP